MSHEEIVTRLSMRFIRIASSPSEIVYAISMQSILSEIVRRLNDKALDLTIADLRMARDEVRYAIGHSLDERIYIAMGLDFWEPARNLNECLTKV